MEINKEHKINKNGSYETTTIIKTTRSDGWNNKDEIIGNKDEPKARYFKGFSKSFKYETNDPKITRPITIIVSIVGMLIAIILLIISIIFKFTFVLFFGIVLLITIISFFINSQKEINKIENDIKKNKQEK